MVQRNPRLTSLPLTTDIMERFNKDICPDTARKIIKKDDYNGILGRKKPFISKVNQQKRIAFAKKHVNKPVKFWNNVIFSDESKFCIFGIKGRQIVWRKVGTALNEQNLVPTVKQGGGGVMVWGCIASSGVGK